MQGTRQLLLILLMAFNLKPTQSYKDMSEESAKRINPYRYKFTIQPSPCTADDQLLIVVHSSTKV